MASYTVFPPNMALLFWDLEIFRITIIFIKTRYYDTLQTNDIFNMDLHDIIYALPQELPYFSHLNFVKWM